MPKLTDKLAIVTGGSGGIGRAAARLFAEEGAKLMLVDLDDAALAATVDKIGTDRAAFAVAAAGGTYAVRSREAFVLDPRFHTAGATVVEEQ